MQAWRCWHLAGGQDSRKHNEEGTLTVAGELSVALTNPSLLGEEAGVVMSRTSLSLALPGQVEDGIWYRPYTLEAVSVFHL